MWKKCSTFALDFEKESLFFTPFCNAILSPFLEYDLPLMNVFRCRQLGLGNKYSINSFDSKRVMNVMEQIKSFVNKPAEPINTAFGYMILVIFLNPITFQNWKILLFLKHVNILKKI